MTRNGKRNGFSASVITAAAVALIVGLAATQAAWAQEKKRVYRWVDEEGNVHYSESLPPNWQGETHDELSHDGMVRDEDVSHAPPPPVEEKPDPKDGKKELPRDQSGLPRPEARYTDAEKQQHMDNLLMLRYHSEQELVDAMEVEINQLKYDERLLTATLTSLEASLKSNIDLAGHSQRAGLEVKDETLKQIASIRSQLNETRQSLQGLQKREEKIRDDFTRDIERYRELVEMYSEEETG